MIEIDIPRRSIRLLVDAGVLAARRATLQARGFKPAQPRKRVVSKALQAYAALTTRAAKGAVRDLSQLAR